MFRRIWMCGCKLANPPICHTTIPFHCARVHIRDCNVAPHTRTHHYTHNCDLHRTANWVVNTFGPTNIGVQLVWNRSKIYIIFDGPSPRRLYILSWNAISTSFEPIFFFLPSSNLCCPDHDLEFYCECLSEIDALQMYVWCLYMYTCIYVNHRELKNSHNNFTNGNRLDRPKKVCRK